MKNGLVPKKPSQVYLDALTHNYTYNRDDGTVHNNKTLRVARGINGRGYMQVMVTLNGKQKALYAHHVIWFFEHGEWPSKQLDHIDGDKTNNHYSNLRECTQRENITFYCESVKSSSKYTGVHWHKARGKWEAKIIDASGKSVYLGLYKCEAAAAIAYQVALSKVKKGLPAR